MTNTLAQWFAVNLGGKISAEVIIFIVSMIPILELRGGLIVASLLHVNMWRALPICIIGNIIPVPFVLLLIGKLFLVLKKTKLKNFVVRLENRALKKSSSLEKGEFIGLMLFVGIPLPGTGAWTGSLLASLLGIKNRKAVPSILLGILIASVIMCIVSYGILGQIF